MTDQPVVEEPSQEIELDEQCAAALDLAREVLATAVPAESIGEHQGVVADSPRLVTHFFACTNKAYVGWRWAVTVTRNEGSDDVTVDETVLLPGEGSLLAPEWLPWHSRVQPGDLGVGDVLPTAPGDPRLVPGYTGTDLDDAQDDDLVPILWELGLGRVQVLSSIGRDEAADRWLSGESGPNSPMAKSAKHQCVSCGFLIPMAGPLGRAFGLCGNEYSPSDGRVVALDFGCGAHSDVEVEQPPVNVVELAVDDYSPSQLEQVLLSALPEEPEEPEVVADEVIVDDDAANADSEADVADSGDSAREESDAPPLGEHADDSDDDTGDASEQDEDDDEEDDDIELEDDVDLDDVELDDPLDEEFDDDDDDDDDDDEDRPGVEPREIELADEILAEAELEAEPIDGEPDGQEEVAD